MKTELLMDAVSRIDTDIIEEYVIMRTAYGYGRRDIPWRRFAAVAASFFIVLCLAALWRTGLLSGMGSDTAYDPTIRPSTEAYYDSVRELEYVIGNGYLVSNLSHDIVSSDSIRLRYVSLQHIHADLDGILPETLHIEQVYEYEDRADTLALDVYFNSRSNADHLFDGRPDGDYKVTFENITKNGVDMRTVSYQTDGVSYGRAQFAHDGAMYVLSVTTDGRSEPLEFYLDMLLSDAKQKPHDYTSSYDVVGLQSVPDSPPIILLLVAFAAGVAVLLPIKRRRTQIIVIAALLLILTAAIIVYRSSTPPEYIVYIQGAILYGDGSDTWRDIARVTALFDVPAILGAVTVTVTKLMVAKKRSQSEDAE